MKHRLGRAGDLLYAGLFGLLVALVVWGLGEALASAEGVRGYALAGWSIFALAVGICIGIATARAIRWHRRRPARES